MAAIHGISNQKFRMEDDFSLENLKVECLNCKSKLYPNCPENVLVSPLV